MLSVRVYIWLWHSIEFIALWFLTSSLFVSSDLTITHFSVVLCLMLLLRVTIIGLIALSVVLFWSSARISFKQFMQLWFGEVKAFIILYSGLQAVPRRWLHGSTQASSNHVILVHGFFCNDGFWFILSRKLLKQNISVSFVEMGSPFASLDRFAELIQIEVEKITTENKSANITIVAFSMGGLAARSCLLLNKLAVSLVTVNTPHQGTYLATISALFGSKNGIQMKPGSDWLLKLNGNNLREEPFPNISVGIWTAHDTIVIPAKLGKPPFHPLLRKAKGHLNAAIDDHLHTHIIRLIKFIAKKAI